MGILLRGCFRPIVVGGSPSGRADSSSALGFFTLRRGPLRGGTRRPGGTAGRPVTTRQRGVKAAPEACGVVRSAGAVDGGGRDGQAGQADQGVNDTA